MNVKGLFLRARRFLSNTGLIVSLIIVPGIGFTVAAEAPRDAGRAAAGPSQPADSLIMEVNYGHDWVGAVTQPGAGVTVSVNGGEYTCTATADGEGQFYSFWSECWSPGHPDLQPGQSVTVSAAGAVATVDPVGAITGIVDADENTLSGTVTASPWTGLLNYQCEVWVENGPTGIDGTVDPAGGSYACDFDDVGWDLQAGQTVVLRYFEPDGDSVINTFEAPYARVGLTWDFVSGWFGSNAEVSFTVNGGAKGGGSGVARPDGWLDGIGCDCDMVPGDTVAITSDAGFDETVTLIDIAGSANLAEDTLAGQVTGGTHPAQGLAEIRNEQTGQGTQAAFQTDSSGAYEVDVTGSWVLQAGDRIEVWYVDPNGNQVGAEIFTVEVQRVDITVGSPDISGFAPAGPVIITRGTETHETDGGWFNYQMDDPFQPGDTVTVEAGAKTMPVEIGILAPFTAEADSAANTVSGQVGMEDDRTIWVSPEGQPEQAVQTSGGGNFTATFDDLPRGARGEIRTDLWVDAAAVGLHRHWQAPDLVLDVNYGHDWVETTYEAGHGITIQVLDAGMTLVATNTGTTGLVPWWGGQTGYATDMGTWDPGRPDIVPGFYVHAVLDGTGEESWVRVGEIAGVLDISGDTVSGAITAAWETGDLEGWCGVWVTDGPGINFTTAPSDRTYSCDFGNVGWDLQPGQTVGVTYVDADGDRVINAFEAPRARVNYRHNSVDGWFGPGVAVTYTVTPAGGGDSKGGGSGTARPDGWMDGVGCNCDIVPGDMVHVTSDAGFAADVLVREITIDIDPAGDVVSGHVADVTNGQGNVNLNSDGRWTGWGMDVAIDGNGDFSLDVMDAGQWDLQPGDQVDAYVYDDNWNQSGNAITGLRIQVETGDDQIWGWTLPDSAVSIEVENTATCAAQADGNGDFWVDTEACTPARPDLAAGDRVIASTADFTADINPVGVIAGTVDADANTVEGTITAPFAGQVRARCEVWTWNGPPSIEQWVDAEGGAYTCDFDDVGFDLQPYHQVMVGYFELDSDQVLTPLRNQYARANVSGDWVDGWFGPGAAVAISVTDSDDGPKCAINGVARANGWLDGIGVGCDMVPGDRVHITASGFDETLTIVPLTAHIDVAQNRVAATVTAAGMPSPGLIGVRDPWGTSWWEVPVAFDGSGAASADFGPLGLDLQAGWSGEAWYIDSGGNHVGIAIESLRIEANYGHDWVNVGTEPFATVDINVEGKATAQVQANKEGWVWSQPEDWDPSLPDIVPGDTIVVTGAGFEQCIEPVGTISGALNLLENVVAGTIDTPFDIDLPVQCEVWPEGGPGSQPVRLQVSGNGGAYACDFDDVGWDLGPNETVAVSYYEPDGDRVINVFWWAAVQPAASASGATGQDLLLTWQHDGQATHYEVWGGSDPYGAAGTLLDTITDEPWEYAETGVIGDPLVHHFYVLRSYVGEQWVDSAAVGEFDFALTPGG